MPESAPSRRHRRWLFAALLLLAVVVALLLGRCRPTDRGPFDWFRAKAEALGRDAQRVTAFVADDVPTLPYQGNVKGALATLWEGAGSPEEKQALAGALLAHCNGGKPAVADPAALHLAIVHRGAAETVVWDGPIGDLVGDVHSIETSAPGKTRITLRATAAVVRDVDAGQQREELLFRVQRTAGQAPLEVVRELWHADNRIGPVAALTGDRHDFVVLPCRILRAVKEQEERLLQQRGRDQGDDAYAYRTLLEYCVRSDLALADLERALKVRARFDLPRILVLSRAKVPNAPAGATALDLRLDRVRFDGASPSDTYLAAQVHSFVESGLEQHFLTEITQQPCTSTWDVFNKLNDDFPNSYDRRMGLVRQALASLGERGRGTFRARKGSTTVTVTKDGERCTVAGGRLDERVVQHLAKQPDATKLGPSCEDTDTAALAVELSLMGAGAAPDYVLEVVDLVRDADSLVVPGARFTFHWGPDANPTDQTVEIEACGEAMQLAWRVQTGMRPVRGMRTITATALADATTHNPWYVQGDDEQGDATSFCVSRRVYHQLHEGKACAMAILGPRRLEDEPEAKRPVAWRGDAVPAGSATHRVLVNGRAEELPLLRVRLGDEDLAILDDARFPVGMADKLTSIRTGIRARLVDESGLGIANADVAAEGHGAVRTGPDGRFALPPLSGKVKLVASRDQKPFGECLVDLEAPGRSEVVVTMPRPRTELLFVTKDNAQDLTPLALSSQARRNVDRYLAAGYQVVIPSHAVEVDGVDVVAWYAHDVASGDIVAVTEDGLHGATASYDRALASLARDLAKAANKPQPFVHVHALRGAIIAWWMYGKERVGGAEHEEAIQKMLDEMDDWEKATNLLTGLEGIPGARSAMGKLMSKAGWDVQNAGASAAFKIGYIGATRFLDHKLEGS